MSNTGFPDDELRREQEFVDGLYARVDALRGDAEVSVAQALAQGSTPRQARLERDILVAERSGLLAALNAVDGSLCFGRIDLSCGQSHHIGRIGLRADDAERTPVLIDWRADVARPFYLATGHTPMGLRRRRHISTEGRRVTALHDEILDLGDETRTGHEDPTGDTVLLAALNSARTGRMGDIVRTIQADQDRIIRAPHRGVLVVEGGPGTGKTAVALHRAAYLLYQDRRRYAGGILIVSPTPLLVAYTEGVLPSLGEEGQVAVRAIGSLVEGVEATLYDSPSVARVKGSSRMLKVLRKAARGALEGDGAPERLRVVAFGRRLELGAGELADVRRTALGGTAPVNLLRPRARKLLLDALWERSGAAGRHTDPELAAELRSSFDEDVASEDDFVAFLDAWWPELTPAAVLDAMADEKRLGRWSRRVLNPGESRKVARSLQREGRSVHDVALLDELRAILGTPARPRRKREIDPLDQLTGLEELMPVREESQRERAERLAQERVEYAHVIVDEAQDLTPMQWRMVGRRGRHATWTVVGDPAQSSWSDPDEAARARDEALGTRPRRRFRLTVNYRNPAEIAELASKVLALAMPGSEPPTAVRSTGVEPRFAVVRDALGETVRREAVRLLERVDGTVGVVVAMQRREEARRWLDGLGDRVVALGSLEAKGLEYDATVVVSPAEIADESPAGLRVLYVALTRATQQLTVVAQERDEPDAAGVPDLLRD